MGLFSRDKYLEESINLLAKDLFDLMVTVSKLHSRVNTLEYKPPEPIKQSPTEDLKSYLDELKDVADNLSSREVLENEIFDIKFKLKMLFKTLEVDFRDFKS